MYVFSLWLFDCQLVEKHSGIIDPVIQELNLQTGAQRITGSPCALIFLDAFAKSEVMRLQRKSSEEKKVSVPSKCPGCCHPTSLETDLMVLYFGVAAL